MDSVNVPWFFTMGVSTFGNPRIEAYLQLPAAYRSLSRPSSAPDAKAFTLCSCSLELLANQSFDQFILVLTFLELLEFLKHWLFRSKKAFILFALSTFRWNCFYPWLERPISRRVNFIRHDLSLCPLYLFFLLFFALFDFQWPQNRLGFVPQPFVGWWRWWESEPRTRQAEFTRMSSTFSHGFFNLWSLLLSLPPGLKPVCQWHGGDDGNRTHDPLLAGQVLSQLSYTPIRVFFWVTITQNWTTKNFSPLCELVSS